MAQYFVAFILIIVLMVVYIRIADRFNIIDKPNERSSHSYITIRGGGVIFPLAALIWFLFNGFYEPLILFSILMIALVSFFDDLTTLSSKIRIIVHFGAVSVLFWQVGFFNLPWPLILFGYLLTIGWINAFNFMDGINGITAFYSLVAIGTFLFINNSVQFTSGSLLIILLLAILVFSFFNVRKRAKVFAGDVGSVGMAFLLAFFMITLILKTGRFEYILLYLVYGIDSVATIAFRLLKRENIFKPHRTHLYQFLSNEFKWPHVLVAAIYGIIQLIVNIITIELIHKDIMDISAFFVIITIFSLLYVIIRLIMLKNLTRIKPLAN